MTTLAPLPGFDWAKIIWGAPDAVRTTVCSYCGDPLPEFGEDFVPLILWTEEGSCAEFCENCQATHWGMSWGEDPFEPGFGRHEPEVRGAAHYAICDDAGVRRCRVCGCSDDRACLGGCFWVEADLCSACVPRAPSPWRLK
jgi:hypothetical protein